MGQHVKAAHERRRIAHNDRAWLAHTTAVLGKQGKPQGLSTLQVKAERSGHGSLRDQMRKTMEKLERSGR